jgi:uncharacterized membrane protein YoaK (UPF0700 family)
MNLSADRGSNQGKRRGVIIFLAALGGLILGAVVGWNLGATEGPEECFQCPALGPDLEDWVVPAFLRLFAGAILGAILGGSLAALLYRRRTRRS